MRKYECRASLWIYIIQTTFLVSGKDSSFKFILRTFGDQGKRNPLNFFSTIETIKRGRIFIPTHIPMKLHYAERYYERGIPVSLAKLNENIHRRCAKILSSRRISMWILCTSRRIRCNFLKKKILRIIEESSEKYFSQSFIFIFSILFSILFPLNGNNMSSIEIRKKKETRYEVRVINLFSPIAIETFRPSFHFKFDIKKRNGNPRKFETRAKIEEHDMSYNDIFQ